MTTGLSTVGRGHDRQSLREDLALAMSYPTIETMGPQTDPNHRAVAREVTQGAGISAVYVTRADATARTTGATRSGGDDHHRNAIVMNYFIQRQA